jgi:hypothetical protein
VCVGGRQVVSFWYFVPSWNFIEGLVCLEPSSFLGVWYLSFSLYQWISHSLMYQLFDILQVMFSSFSILVFTGYLFFWVSYLSCVDLILESLEHAYLLYVHCFACFLSLTQYIGKTPPSLKLAKMCMKFNFTSICTYLCGVCPMYWWFSNSLVPMSLGTMLFEMFF